MNSHLDRLATQSAARYEEKKEGRQKMLQFMEQRQMQRDYELLATPIDPNLGVGERMAAEKIREMIRQKYGLE
jgi:hypothetical protein